jgi:hypothetical protein
VQRDNQDENFLTQIVAQRSAKCDRVCRNTLNEVVTAALTDTILGWYRRLVAPDPVDRVRVESRADRQSVRRRVDRSQGEGESLLRGRLVWVTRFLDQTVGNVSAPSRPTAGAGAQAYDDLGRISVELLTLQWRAAPTSLRCTSSACEDWWPNINPVALRVDKNNMCRHHGALK